MSRLSLSFAFFLSSIGVFLAGAAAEAQPSGIPPVTVSPFVFPEELEPESMIGTLRYRGAVVIESAEGDASPFFGLSGFWVSPDGNRFAGTEGGNWVEGTLAYDDDGNLNGFAIDRKGQLLDEDGDAFRDERDLDAESLDYDGTQYLVGFETHDRVLRYRDFESPAEPIALPPEALEGIADGAGFSSVVHLPDGTIIALPELTRPERTRGWLMTEEAEGLIWLREPEDFWLPVSLSSFPNGDLLVLEIFVPQQGTANVTRLGRISAESIAIGSTMEPVEIATLEPPLTEARFEGSAISTGPRGETNIYVMYNASPAVLFMFELLE